MNKQKKYFVAGTVAAGVAAFLAYKYRKNRKEFQERNNTEHDLDFESIFQDE